MHVAQEEELNENGRRLTAVLSRDLEDGGYIVNCKEKLVTISQGETTQEALDNLGDAIELCLEFEEELRQGRIKAK